jgi:peptidyl-dipeptidase A
MDTAVIETFIARFEERVAPVEKALGEAWWDLSTTGTEEAQRELVHAGTEYNRLFADRDEYASVRGWYEGRGSLEISLLRRQVEVLYRAFAGRQGDEETLTRIEELEAEANAVFGNHRGTVGEKEARENEIREILRSSDDEALRREAWEAQKGVGREAEGIVRELARLRNRLARAEGYENHHARSLDLQEIDDAELDRLLGNLEAATRRPFEELKGKLDADLRRRFGVERVMPWHHSDPSFQSCKNDPVALPRPASRRDPGVGARTGSAGLTSDRDGLGADRYFRGKELAALTRETYDGMGLEVRDVLARSDLRERTGKSQHAFCLRVGRE